MSDIVLIAHNIRSCHNVGSLLRTAEGLGIQHVYLTGYTPYPVQTNDIRLPHEARKIDKQITKTALGAQLTQSWSHHETIQPVIKQLQQRGYTIAALEQTPQSQQLPTYKSAQDIAIVVGREVEGIEPEVLELSDVYLEIPMVGKKESFNVAVAAAIALYHCQYNR